MSDYIPSLLTPFCAALFPALMIWAALQDGLYYKIPNRIPAALAAGFFPFWLLTDASLPGLVSHAICGFAVLGASLYLFNKGILGGGDGKLLAAGALWLGWSHLLTFLFITTLAGGVLAAAFMVWPALTARYHGKGRPVEPPPLLPYGIAIASGGLYTFPLYAAGL